MKKWKLAGVTGLLLLSLIALFQRGGEEAAVVPPARERVSLQPRGGGQEPDVRPVFHRDIRSVNLDAMTFTPWDVEAASACVDKQPPRPHTVMIYMNGSDLESETGAATADLVEMLESGVDTGLVNIVILTGGTHRWRNDVIPAGECALWRVAGRDIEKLSGIGLVNMGDPGTLASFIEFGRRNFPARKHTLLFWDHGGGSIAGYGHDENFDNDRLSLLALNCALERAGLADNPLETIGFDACLMATVEMGVIASRYARWFVASEDLEPGDGWDYGFLSVLNDGDAVDGAVLGRAIVDSYIDFYGEHTPENVTLSVTDLSLVGGVMGAMDALMDRCADGLDTDSPVSFHALSKRRYATKTFGDGSPRDNDCDMVDIGHMAHMLYDLYPLEAEEVLSALEDAVTYNRYDCDIDVYGLSAFYLFGGRQDARSALQTYRALRMSPAYTEYLAAFAERLTEGGATRSSPAERDELLRVQYTQWRPIPGRGDRKFLAGITEPEGEASPSEALWPQLEGTPLCLYELYRCDEGVAYAAPAELDGEGVDIIVFRDYDVQAGRLLGIRRQDGYLIQKGLDPIKGGQRVSFCYETSSAGGDTAETRWHKDAAVAVKQDARVVWAPCGEEEVFFGLRTTDTRHAVADVA